MSLFLFAVLGTVVLGILFTVYVIVSIFCNTMTQNLHK